MDEYIHGPLTAAWGADLDFLVSVMPATAATRKIVDETLLRTRNSNLDPRLRDIARHYQVHGEKWRVRWDYAFYQMAVETNFLTYRAPGGRMGDVNPKSNNFAGIGTTGGGVPGDTFPDVSTGVLAQIQHLVVYSGQRLDNPTAPRTRLKMDEILTKSEGLGLAVTFQDLSGRWAADRAYGRSIEWAAHASNPPIIAAASMMRSANIRQPGAG